MDKNVNKMLDNLNPKEFFDKVVDTKPENRTWLLSVLLNVAFAALTVIIYVVLSNDKEIAVKREEKIKQELIINLNNSFEKDKECLKLIEQARLGTTFSLANPIIASNPATAASLYVPLKRTYNIRNDVLFAFAGNNPTDEMDSGNAPLTTPITRTENWNIYITAQLQNGADSITLETSRVVR